jgi:inhibitor of cysteine peptidase
MRQFGKSIFWVAGICVMLSACSSSNPSDPVALTIYAEQDGGTVEVQVGDTFAVVLEANPTTGYTWEAESYDPGLLQPQGDPEFEPDSDAVGAGGMMTLKFTALAPGQTWLRLVYHRPWEEDAAPLETFAILVMIAAS